jgi:hypothetical protein
MLLDAEFKDIASRVAAILIDLDLMRGEPYFSDADITHASMVVGQQVDALLRPAGLTRAGFIRRLGRTGFSLSANFLRGSFVLLDQERNRHEAR